MSKFHVTIKKIYYLILIFTSMTHLRRMSVILVISVMLLSMGWVGLSDEAFADKKGKSNTTQIINLGYLQLAAHDFFDMNREIEIDNEIT